MPSYIYDTLLFIDWKAGKGNVVATSMLANQTKQLSGMSNSHRGGSITPIGFYPDNGYQQDGITPIGGEILIISM